jgi:hypothetical protein
MTDDRRPPRALEAFAAGLIDYAGLFPPAGLSMADAVAQFGRYRQSPTAWALGRFVVPVARLGELEREAAALSGRDEIDRPWPLAALASSSHHGDFGRIAEFNAAHAGSEAPWHARIRSAEIKAASPADVERACASAPPGLELYFEAPADAAIDDLCRAAAVSGHALKLRTGGTTFDAFPPSAVVARALAACAAARVPFKATAGLHHAVRGLHPVSDEAGAPSAAMHGFLNLFVAALLLYAGKADAAMATQVLEDELGGSFRFDEDGLSWRDRGLTTREVVAARRFARSFGSCSFADPSSALQMYSGTFST